MMKKILSCFVMLLLYISCAAPVARAADTSTSAAGSTEQTLTIDQAVDLALASSKTIKSADLGIQIDSENRDQISSNLKYIPIGPTTPSARNLYKASESADIALAMAKKSKSSAEDGILYSVFSDYIDVLNNQETLEYDKTSLALDQTKLNTANVGYNVGTVSKYDRDAAEVLYEGAKATVATDETNLTKSYQTLNKLLGLDPGARPVLTDKPAYSKLVTDNPEAQALRVIDESPTIWNYDQQVTLAQIDRDLFDYSSSSSTYLAQSLAVDQAKISADEARSTMKQTVRTLYNGIIALEESIPALQQNVEIAQRALDIAQVKFDVGLATKQDLQTAQQTLEMCQKTLDSKIFSHELAKIAYDKPWAASGSTSSAAAGS